MTRARTGALAALTIGLAMIAVAGWWLRPQADPRSAFGQSVGAFEVESEDIGGTGVPIRRVSFPRAAGTQDRATGLLAVPPGERSPMPAVLYLHGLGADATDFAPEALLMAARGAVVLCLDSADVREGRPPSRGLRALREDLARRRSTAADIRAALALLADRSDVDASRIAMVGFSRGAAAGALAARDMTALAAEVYVSGGARLSTWPGRLGEVGAGGRVEARRLAAAIDPARALRLSRQTRPRLVQLGTADQVIARRDLEAFARAARAERRLERYDGAPHALDYAAMRSRLRWLDRELGVEGPSVPGHLTEPPAGW